MFSLMTSEIFQLTHRYRYQFAGEVMTDMRSIKAIIQCATLGIPKGMKKCNFLSIVFCLDFLIRNENITSEECKEKPFEIISHVGRFTSLQRCLAKKIMHVTVKPS